MSKKAILLVSFGTTHKDTREKTLNAIKTRVIQEFREYSIYEAYTSGKVIKKIAEVELLHIFNINQAMKQIISDGIEELIVQPTHVIRGIEFEKIVDIVNIYKHNLKKIVISNPLLTTEEDYHQSVKAVNDNVIDIYLNNYMEHSNGTKKDIAFVLMGHGTEHNANVSYEILQRTFLQSDRKNIFVATVEGIPCIDDIIKLLKEKAYKHVVLMPFMIVAGDHAKNDMAGENDSWKSSLLEHGFSVDCIMNGLGEITDIQNIYINHIMQAIDLEH